MDIKVYVVMPVDQTTGLVNGEPIAAKLTRGAAQAVSKKNAPARVVGPLFADKLP